MSGTNDFSYWRPHPWHGLDVGPAPPGTVHAYIEITPFDVVKYESDKRTGFLRIDRPQQMSSLPPALYGFIPRTLCGSRVASFTPGTNEADGDPLDICVISERPVNRVEIVLDARVLGGFQTVDRGKADDKIVAVLVKDSFWGAARDVADLPTRLLERLRHYFLTYKMIPGEVSEVSAANLYHRDHALEVVQAAMEDYAVAFPPPTDEPGERANGGGHGG